MISSLSELPSNFRRLLVMVLVALTLGVSLGLGLVFISTSGTLSGITTHYQGDHSDDTGGIPDHYPMPVQELLITTHNHILTFTFIFGFLGGLIQLASRLKMKWKILLAAEPFISIIFTFGSMWGIRFVGSGFVWLMLISSGVMYFSFYIMIIVIIKELVFPKPTVTER